MLLNFGCLLAERVEYDVFVCGQASSGAIPAVPAKLFFAQTPINLKTDIVYKAPVPLIVTLHMCPENYKQKYHTISVS